MTHSTDDELSAGIAAITAEGGGVLRLDLHSATILPDLWDSYALHPTAAGARLLGAFERLGRAILDAPADEPRRCLTCNAPFGDGQFPLAIGVLEPCVPEPTKGIVHGFCPDCVARHDDAGLTRLALDALSAWADWDIRLLDQSHAAGHA